MVKRPSVKCYSIKRSIGTVNSNDIRVRRTLAKEKRRHFCCFLDIVIPQEYGISRQEKLAIGLGVCAPLLKKIRADLHRNTDLGGEGGEGSEGNPTQAESENRLNPQYSHGVSSPGRHVRTR